MKNILLAFLFLGLFTSTYAQSKGEMPEKLNCIKINPLSLGVRTINFQYERVVHSNMTVCLRGRYTIPKTYTASVLYPDGVDFTDLNYGGFAFIPEFRYYVKEAMNGFYVAPYAIFRQANVDFKFPIPRNGIFETGDFDGKSTSFGGGLAIGVHKQLGNNFSFDFSIFGLQYVKSDYDFKSVYSNLTTTEQQNLYNNVNNSLNTMIDRFKIKDAKFLVGPNTTDVSFKYGGLWPRGLNVSIGYRF